MKINDTLTWTNEQKPLCSQKPCEDFGHWLQNPTQHSSGDEYYWQHLNQLQQSSLHFDAKTLINQQQKQAPNGPGEAVFNPPDHRDKPVLAEQKHTDSEQSQIAHENSSIEELISFIVALEHTDEPDSFVSTMPANQQTIESDLKTNEMNAPTVTPITYTSFKNSHLFIQGTEVELTLNTQTLNKQEQKDLMQLIKEHLKKKGLVLNSLIINGVKNA